MDLIEIAPTAKPPVAKIMAYDKYRYQQEKLFKKQRAAQKTSGLKHVRISIRTQKNDLEVAARKVNEFLAEGHKVEIQVHLRGREKSMRDLAKQKFHDFLKYLTVEFKITVEPSFGMRGMSAQISQK
jgi:translation initiation factor IF-3